MIKASDVKALREKTGAGMMDCKNALVETNGDMDEAIKVLREKGLASAAKKAGRIAAEGIVESYIHMGGKIGVLVEVNCETDFVAKTPAFKTLVRDIAMQIAASNPLYLSTEMCLRRISKTRRRSCAYRRSMKASPRKSLTRWWKAVFKSIIKKSVFWNSRMSRILIKRSRIL